MAVDLSMLTDEERKQMEQQYAEPKKPRVDLSMLSESEMMTVQDKYVPPNINDYKAFQQKPLANQWDTSDMERPKFADVEDYNLAGSISPRQPKRVSEGGYGRSTGERGIVYDPFTRERKLAIQDETPAIQDINRRLLERGYDIKDKERERTFQQAKVESLEKNPIMAGWAEGIAGTKSKADDRIQEVMDNAPRFLQTTDEDIEATKGTGGFYDQLREQGFDLSPQEQEGFSQARLGEGLGILTKYAVLEGTIGGAVSGANFLKNISNPYARRVTAELIEELGGVGVVTASKLFNEDSTLKEVAGEIPQELVMSFATALGVGGLRTMFKGLGASDEAIDSSLRKLKEMGADIEVDDIRKADVRFGEDSLEETRRAVTMKEQEVVNEIENFQQWRKENFDGAHGQLPEEDMNALKELYAEDTGTNIDELNRELEQLRRTDELAEVSGVPERNYSELEPATLSPREVAQEVSKPQSPIKNIVNDNGEIETVNTRQMAEMPEDFDVVTVKDDSINVNEEYLDAVRRNEKLGEKSRVADRTEQILREFNGRKMSELTEPEKVEFRKAQQQLKYASEQHKKLMYKSENADDFIDSSVKEIQESNKFSSDMNKDAKQLGARTYGVLKGFLETFDQSTVAKLVDPSEGKFYNFVQNSVDAVSDLKNKTILDLTGVFEKQGIDLEQLAGQSLKRGQTENVLIGGRNVKMSPRQKVTLKLMSQNEQVKNSIMEDGFVLSNAPSKTETTLFPTAEEIDAISLTPEEQAYADATDEMFAIAREKITKIYKDLYGVEPDFVENYFPTRRRGVNIETSDFQTMFNNMQSSIFKERTGGGVAYEVGDVFGLVDDYIKTVGNASIEPYVYDLQRIINDDRMIKAFNSITGVNAENGKNVIQEYMGNFMKELRQTKYTEKLENERTFDRFVNKVISSNILYNITTAPKQFGSFIGSVREIDPRYLIRGLFDNTTKRGDDLLERYPELKMRQYGKFTRETAQVMEKGGKFTQTGAKGIKAVDMYTVSSIYRGAEAQIEATTNLKRGTDEFINATKKLARKALATQPNYTSVYRSPILQSKNTATKLLTSYSTYPMRQWSNVTHDLFGAINGTKGAKTKLARTIGGIIGANAMGGYIGMKARDLSGVTDFEKIEDNELERLGKETANYTMNIVPIYGKIMSQLLSGFEFRDMATEQVQQMYDTIVEFEDIVTKNYKTDLLEDLEEGRITEEQFEKQEGRRLREYWLSFADSLSGFTGISPETMKRSLDIGIGALAESPLGNEQLQKARTEFQLSTDEPYNQSGLLNRLEREQAKDPDSTLIPALTDELALKGAGEVGGDVFQTMPNLTQPTQQFMQQNARQINRDGFYNPERMQDFDSVVANTGQPPQEVFDAINEARDFYKRNKDKGRFKDWTREEIMMYRLYNNKDIRDGETGEYRTTARMVGDLIFGFPIDDEKYPTKIRGGWSPYGK